MIRAFLVTPFVGVVVVLLIGVVVLLGVVGCGASGDFSPSPPPDLRVTLDLATVMDGGAVDSTCFNTACGGCSQLAGYDGTPAKVGDLCLWKGIWQCNGAQLVCSDTSCLGCGSAVTGSVCGADGHTIVELVQLGGTCRAYDFNSAIAVCNHGPTDHCVARCAQTGAGYSCTARCTSDDGGGTGCAHTPSESCTSLTSC